MGTTLEDILKLSQQLSQPDQQAPQQMPVARPSTVVGLLGSALGGGSSGNVGLTQEQADAEGRGALLNFGLNMLEASGYSNRRRGLGEIFAKGVRGAQGAIGDYESQLAARQAALQAQQQQQIQNRREALNTALPILKFTQEQQNLADAKRQLLGDRTGPGGGDGEDIYSLPKDQFLARVAKRESGGDPTAMNYVAKADPTAWDRGATATGKYQMVASTWRTAAKLAGIDTTKYPRAMDAPEADQDRAASLLYDQQGTNPWNPAKFGQHWVKDDKTGKYTLVQGAGEGTGGGRGPPATTPPPASTTPPKAATTALPTPPEPPEGMLPSPIRPETTAPANVGRGPGGAVVAGPPGAATVGPARPAGPEAQSDAEAIARGMIGAGADPETLAAGAPSRGPGTLAAGPAGGETTPRAAAIAQAQATNTPTQVEGVPGLWALPNGSVINRAPSAGLPGTGPPVPEKPAATPPSQTTGAAQPAAPGQPPAPGLGQAEIGATPTRPHAFQPTLAVPPDDPRFSPDLTPEDEKGFTTRLQQIESDRRLRIANAKSTEAVTQAQADADAKKEAVIKDRQDAMRGRLSDSRTAIAGWQKEERDRQYERYKSEQFAAEPSDLARAGITPQPGVIYTVDNFGKVQQQKVEIDPRLQKQAEGDYETFKTEYQAPYIQLGRIRPALDQMDVLRRRIQANGGAATGLTGEYLRHAQQAAASLGFAPENVGNLKDVQVLESLAQQAILTMKKNVALGNTSNQDMDRVSAQIPNMMQTLAGQEKLSAILKQLWNYQELTYKEANRAIRDPSTGYTFRDLDERIAKLPAAIPSLPPESVDWKEADFLKWRKDNRLQKGMVYFDPSGNAATVMR